MMNPVFGRPKGHGFKLGSARYRKLVERATAVMIAWPKGCLPLTKKVINSSLQAMREQPAATEKIMKLLFNNYGPDAKALRDSGKPVPQGDHEVPKPTGGVEEYVGRLAQEGGVA